ncbi:MAG: N-6 DNA methylase [Planctomycetota bacterium]
MTNIPPRVAELVETFGQHIEAYRSQQYNETQVRREFIDPFFEQLGWDVTNKAGYAHAYKDVIHEDAIKIGGATKAPDYCFRIGGVRKFFLEAKKPSVDIKGDPHPAYQLRRYAWSAKLPLSILTDFEEFAVYDCRIRPKQTDRADNARIMLFSYKDYLKNWSRIAEVFSREAILKGSFDKFAAATKGKRGTSTVDKEFLAEIEKWRNMLARIIALRNRTLSVREINFSVQRTIDRILFLRMCEDRGIETYGQLQSIISGERTYPRLCEVFEKADQKYNSGLFHFHDEPDRTEGPDELTPNIIIDDKDLKWILHSLYYPQSPYEFSVLPLEILGNVYEQFLGKVITLTTGHRANVEDKPEVKKAGGVYYTPSYIVDYIVTNTVGKLCEGKTPRQVENLRILDPACGSGSFLIGAYQYLLDWHLRFYTENDPAKNAKGRNPKIYEANSTRHCEEPGDKPVSYYRLTITEKKRILLNNIFGVDIDSQAVEVTKLSLLLKVLEGEDAQTLENQYRLFHERALPDLAANIKCGNSLIGPDFYSSCHSREGGNPEELRDKINAFDWHAEFPDIFSGKNPGFDAVIGNPPYVRIQGFPREQVHYFTQRYSSAVKNFDIYVNFVEMAYSLLQSHGLLGFILPNKFFRTDYGEGLRAFLSSERAVAQVVDFKASQVFGGSTYTCLLFLSRNPVEEAFYAESEGSPSALDGISFARISASSLGRGSWSFRSGKAETLLLKIRQGGVRLLDVPADMSRGSSTGADAAFILEDDSFSIEAEVLRTPLFASDFGRYVFSLSHTQRIIFPYDAKSGDYSLYSESDLRTRFPNAFRYLSANRRVLEKRKQYKTWFSFSAPRNLELHDRACIAVPLLARQGSFALIPAQLRGTLCPMASGGFTINLPAGACVCAEYLLGLLNSRLLYWTLEQTSNIFRGGWITCTKQYFGELPIRIPDTTKHREKDLCDRMISLVQQMLDLHKKLATAKVPGDKTRIQRQIDASDKQIDQLVYALYGLTEEEIKIVEGALDEAD